MPDYNEIMRAEAKAITDALNNKQQEAKNFNISE